MTLSVISVAAI